MLIFIDKLFTNVQWFFLSQLNEVFVSEKMGLQTRIVRIDKNNVNQSTSRNWFPISTPNDTKRNHSSANHTFFVYGTEELNRKLTSSLLSNLSLICWQNTGNNIARHSGYLNNFDLTRSLIQIIFDWVSLPAGMFLMIWTM